MPTKAPVSRAAYWASKPEKEWARTAGPGLWDRRAAIRLLAAAMKSPRVLEIGIDDCAVLKYCWDAFGTYVGVDLKVRKEVRDYFEENPICCPYDLIEMPSEDYWKSLKKEDLFDLVYVDGHHGIRETHLDITQAMLRLAPGGFILAHDMDVNEGVDTGPVWAFNRLNNLPGWYARVLEGHPEGLAIFLREND